MPQARKRGYSLVAITGALLLMHGDTIIAAVTDATTQDLIAARQQIAHSLRVQADAIEHPETEIELNPTFKADCINRLNEGEPFMTLRGQDMLAPTTVRNWSNQVRLHCSGVATDKADDADSLALAMEKWHPRKLPD